MTLAVVHELRGRKGNSRELRVLQFSVFSQRLGTLRKAEGLRSAGAYLDEVTGCHRAPFRIFEAQDAAIRVG